MWQRVPKQISFTSTLHCWPEPAAAVSKKAGAAIKSLTAQEFGNTNYFRVHTEQSMCVNEELARQLQHSGGG